MNKNTQCPVCGYYCLGNGGIGCIDKPSAIVHECGESCDHNSDCAVHNEPAYRNKKCDCRGGPSNEQ
jgi:hypothetical protein